MLTLVDPCPPARCWSLVAGRHRQPLLIQMRSSEVHLTTVTINNVLKGFFSLYKIIHIDPLRLK